jgi:hypothetical protein
LGTARSIESQMPDSRDGIEGMLCGKERGMARASDGAAAAIEKARILLGLFRVVRRSDGMITRGLAGQMCDVRKGRSVAAIARGENCWSNALAGG